MGLDPWSPGSGPGPQAALNRWATGLPSPRSYSHVLRASQSRCPGCGQVPGAPRVSSRASAAGGPASRPSPAPGVCSAPLCGGPEAPGHEHPQVSGPQRLCTSGGKARGGVFSITQSSSAVGMGPGCHRGTGWNVHPPWLPSSLLLVFPGVTGGHHLPLNPSL